MTSQSQEKHVARFLRQLQCSESIKKYVLRHAGKGSRGHDIETFEINEALEPSDLDILASTIHGRAQMDADGLGPDIQRYTLTAYLGDDKAVSRVAFRVRGEADVDLDEERETGEEAPNMRGMTQQLMRHNEANNRTLVGSMGIMLQAMGRRLDASEKLNERLLEDRMKQFQLIEDARSQEAERQMMIESERSKHEMIRDGVKKATMLLPVAIDYVTKGKFAVRDTPLSIMLKNLTGSMTLEQVQAIASQLKPEQQIVFFQLIQNMQGDSEKPKDEGEKVGSNGVEVS